MNEEIKLIIISLGYVFLCYFLSCRPIQLANANYYIPNFNHVLIKKLRINKSISQLLYSLSLIKPHVGKLIVIFLYIFYKKN